MDHPPASPGPAALRRSAVCLQRPGAAAAGHPPGGSPAAASEPEVLVLAPIVVTAEKQEENLQDVPQSITVLTGDAIREADIRVGVGGRRPRRVAGGGLPEKRLQCRVRPLAFPFALAPSRYVGESGAPQVAEVTVGVQF